MARKLVSFEDLHIGELLSLPYPTWRDIIFKKISPKKMKFHCFTEKDLSKINQNALRKNKGKVLLVKPTSILVMRRKLREELT